MGLSAEDSKRISAAIHAAEGRTSGEIVCVLAQSSVTTTALPVFLAAGTALAMPWMLVALTTMTVHRILSLQLLTFACLVGLLCWPPIRILLMPRRVQRAMAHDVAMKQFVARGLARKKERTAILIFVSLAERYARIVADEGISSRVPQSSWQTAVDALVAHMRDGRIAEGFIAAIELCGDELAKNFPRAETSRDELPDRLYLI